MDTIRSLLLGKKTYIVAAVAVIVTGLHGMGYIDDQTYKVSMGILGPLGLMTLRAGIARTMNGDK
jgi:hypothetical protein